MNIEIIAEIAQGFEGDPVKSMLMLKSSAKAGADAAKFQMIYADELATVDYKHYKLFKSLEMDDQVWADLIDCASELGIELQIDIFGMKSLSKCEKFNIKTVKIHPTDISNIALLNSLSSSPIPRVLLGIGGANASEIETAVNALSGKSLVLIAGFQGYPTPIESNQISRIPIIKQQFHTNSMVSVGFADHELPESDLTSLVGAMAIGAGATLLEKHMTLNRVLEMEDFESALNPDEFSVYCNRLREASKAIGNSHQNGNYGMSVEETGYRNAIRRHVVAAHNISMGQTLSPFDVALKRTSSIAPITDLEIVYGKTVAADIKVDAPITPEQLC